MNKRIINIFFILALLTSLFLLYKRIELEFSFFSIINSGTRIVLISAAYFYILGKMRLALLFHFSGMISMLIIHVIFKENYFTSITSWISICFGFYLIVSGIRQYKLLKKKNYFDS